MLKYMILGKVHHFPFFPTCKVAFGKSRQGLIDRMYEEKNKNKGSENLGLQLIGWYYQRGLYYTDVVIN